MGGILRVEIIVLSTSPAILSVGGRDLQNLNPNGLNEAKQAGSIAAGGFDPDPLDLTKGSHPGEHLPVTLSGRGKALAPQNTVTFINDGGDMQILVGVHAANDMSPCCVPDVHSKPPGSTVPLTAVKGSSQVLPTWPTHKTQRSNERDKCSSHCRPACRPRTEARSRQRDHHSGA
jgi:hypothetical protein